MKRLSIAELKAQKGAVVNTELYMGGELNCCHEGQCKPTEKGKIKRDN